MSRRKLVGLAGSYNRPSKTRSLVETVAGLAGDAYGFSTQLYDLHDVGHSLGQAIYPNDLDATAKGIIAEIVSADLLVIGSPTYKGSYPGLFKHLIDLIEPDALRGKPVLLVATGGGDRHALMVEHQLRPLFGFFMSHTLPTAAYASDRDFTDYKVTAEPLRRRIEQAVDEIAAFFPSMRIPSSVAAE